jgi:hypothetical protein
MRSRLRLVAAVASLLLIVFATTVWASSARAADPLSRVVVDQGPGKRLGGFRDAADGAAFVPRGANYIRLAQAPGGSAYHSTFEPGQYDPARVEAALTAMQRDGFDVVRVFVDGGSIPDANAGHPHGLGRGVDDHGTVYGPYMDNVADFLRRADAHCIRTIVNLDGFPANAHYYTEVADRPPSPDIDGPNLLVLDSMHVQAREAYVGDFVSGLRDRLGAERLSAVLAYQLENEGFVLGNAKPFGAGGPASVTAANGRTYDMASFGAGGDRQRAVDGSFTYLANRLTTAIRRVDPGALVTLGTFTHAAVGKAGPDGVAQNCTGGGCPAIDYRYPARPAVLARDTELSFLDVHLYPAPQPGGVNDPYSLDRDLATSEWQQVAGKPAIVGEYGALKSFWGDDVVKAAFGMRDLQVDTCRMGFGGWVSWTFDTNEPLAEQERFFSLADGGGAINGQLAPIARPDPCDATVVSPYRSAGTCNRVAPVPPVTQPPAPAPGARRRKRRATVTAARRGVRLTVWRASLRQALKEGLRVTVRAPGRGRLTVVARHRGGRIAIRRLQARRAGTQRVHLHIARRPHKRLRAARSARIGVEARFRPARGRAVTVRVKLLLRR